MRKLRTIKTRVHARTSHRFSLSYAVTINSDFHIVTLNISFRLFFNSDPTLHIQLTTLHVYVHYCIYTYSICGLTLWLAQRSQEVIYTVVDQVVR